MKLKAFVASLEEVDEPHRALYVEELDDKGAKTGRWKLDAEGVEDTKALRNALQRSSDETKRLKEQAERFKNVNPDEYHRLLNEAANREVRETQIQQEAEQRIREAEETHRRQLERKDGEISRLKSQRDTLFLDAQLLPAISAEKGTPEFLLPHLRSRVKVTEKDGQLKLEILNPEGARMLNKEGKEAAPSDLVLEYKEHKVFSRAFEGTGASGAGTEDGGHRQTGTGNGRGREDGANPFLKGSWNKTAQSALVQRDAKGNIQHDDNRERAERLARQAGFASLDAGMAALRPNQ